MSLEQPLTIARPDAIVLGLGWATLVPTESNSDAAVRIADVDGAQLASVLLDAHHSSHSLLTVGDDNATHLTHSDNPVMLSDVFFRIGGFVPAPVHVDQAVVINSDDAVADHFWIWRADHGVRDSVGWNVNTSDYGLVVNGDRFTVYGLFNEHFQKYLRHPQQLCGASWISTAPTTNSSRKSSQYSQT